MKITFRLEALTKGEKEVLATVAGKGPGRFRWLPVDPIFDPEGLDRANWTISEREARGILPAAIMRIIHRLRRSKGWVICAGDDGKWGINTPTRHTLRRAGLDPDNPDVCPYPRVKGASCLAVVRTEGWDNIWGIDCITPRPIVPQS